MSEPAPTVACRALHRSFGDSIALDGFNLEVRPGELLVLLGPSGCGKSTALRLIAGLDRPDEGTVEVAGRPVAGGSAWVPPERRRIGMVFQDWALFPHLDVEANVAFGVAGPDRVARVAEILRLVRLEGLEARMPHELSGGQQQRVAIARALAPEPAVLLLDEPFSNLDAQLRAEVRAEIRDLHARTGTTAVFVTHDQEEALSLADRVAVMSHGRVLQVGSPQEVYASPTGADVAALIGQSNLFAATVSGGIAATAIGPIPAPGQPDGPTRVLLRPEIVVFEPDARGVATVRHVEYYGHDQLVRAELANGARIESRLMGAHPDLVDGAVVHVALTDVPTFLPSGDEAIDDAAGRRMPT